MQQTLFCAVLSLRVREREKFETDSAKRGGTKLSKSSTPRDKFDIKLCEVAFHSLNVTVFFFWGRGDQHWLSNQCRGEQRILASTTPRGGKQCSSCFAVDLSLVDMSCFPLRLVQRLTGSFEPFLQGDMDVVIWIELLGPDSWWHGFLRIQANSWLPCREPL